VRALGFAFARVAFSALGTDTSDVSKTSNDFISLFGTLCAGER
jgi:hypothetical protein